MTTDTMPTGIDIEAMAREAGAYYCRDDFDATTDIEFASPDVLEKFAAAILDRAASIAERMGLDAQSDEAKRLAVEIGAAIRSEVS